MATLRGMPAYTGSMGGLSAYKMRGVDRIVLREKGGPTKKQIKKDPAFAITRRRNEEWSGSAMGVARINLALHGVRHLYDYNYTSDLMSVCRSIQDDDHISELGRRTVLFSQSHFKLEGFGLNSYHPFDMLLRHPLKYEMDKNAGTALIELPDIIPGIHLINQMKQPYYRIVFVLGGLADIIYDEKRKMYRPAADMTHCRAIAQTAWRISKEKCEAQSLQPAIENWQLQPGVSLMLSAGVEFGQPSHGGTIQFTKYAGAAKILKLV